MGGKRIGVQTGVLRSGPIITHRVLRVGTCFLGSVALFRMRVLLRIIFRAHRFCIRGISGYLRISRRSVISGALWEPRVDNRSRKLGKPGYQICSIILRITWLRYTVRRVGSDAAAPVAALIVAVFIRKVKHVGTPEGISVVAVILRADAVQARGILQFTEYAENTAIVFYDLKFRPAGPSISPI